MLISNLWISLDSRIPDVRLGYTTSLDYVFKFKLQLFMTFLHYISDVTGQKGTRFGGNSYPEQGRY